MEIGKSKNDRKIKKNTRQQIEEGEIISKLKKI